MCLLIGLAIPFPWLSLFVCGKVWQGCVSLAVEIIGIIMICLVVIPLLGWIIAILGLAVLLGNIAFAVTTVVNSQQSVGNVQNVSDDE